MSDNIRFGYSSSSNITFNGEIETNISREEWDEMSKREQDDVMAEELFQLVDLHVIDE